MNGKSEWVNQGECIRITTRRRVSSLCTERKEGEKQKDVDEARRKRQTDGEAERVQRQVNRGTAGMACLQIV